LPFARIDNRERIVLNAGAIIPQRSGRIFR
jgi:hypothetical protein